VAIEKTNPPNEPKEEKNRREEGILYCFEEFKNSLFLKTFSIE